MPESGGPPPGETMSPAAVASILIVDDDPGNLGALRELLQGLGQKLVLADSGEGALRCVLKEDFAVILLDARMPGVDGFETAKLIRERPRSRHTPIIFITGAYEDVRSVFRGYEVGAVDYIVKPLDPRVLKSKVSVFVELHAKNAALRREIAEHKLTEQRLRESEENLRALAALIGFEPTAIEPGHAVVEMEASERHANPMGTLHGGVLCDIADAAMGMAFASTLEVGQSFTTLELKINLLRPVWRAKLVAAADRVDRAPPTLAAWLPAAVDPDEGPSVALGYDARGNATTYGTLELEYDALGRLVEADLCRRLTADVAAPGQVVLDAVPALAQGDGGQQPPQALAAAQVVGAIALAAEEAEQGRLHDVLGALLLLQRAGRTKEGEVDVRVHHYSRLQGGVPLNIVEWQRRTGALAVFNAGQYYPDLSYMGLLVSDGVRVSTRLHPGFKAALVASPDDGRAEARVLDLDRDPIDPAAPGWREVAQSFMLFERGGRPRIRKSDVVANRTAVAQDGKGRILVITSEGGYTLWDFAQLLQKAPIGLSHAMCMDGGYEAELCVSIPPFHYASFGRWKGQDDVPDAPGAKVPLPAVIAVVAR